MKTIFLVDDDLTNLSTGEAALEEHYNVLTLDSGQRLLAVLEKTIPDLVLLDVEMPGMNGYETIKAIKSKSATKHIPVIFLSGKIDDGSEHRGLSLGAADYVTKPFCAPLLIKRIESQLTIEAQKKELAKLKKFLVEDGEEN